MRTIAILTLAASTVITAIIYSLSQQDAALERPEPGTSSISATSGVAVKDLKDELAIVLRRYEQADREQAQQAQLWQARLDRRLGDLEARLRSVESARVDEIQNPAGSSSVEQAMDTVLSNAGVEEAEPAKVSESEFGSWMDETLRVGYFDHNSTKLATEEAVKTLAKAPGVNLDDMQCGDRFCRATFANETGEVPVIEDLFGEPPFVTEGFTVTEPDGRVALYFTRPGESLSGLRSEASEPAPGYPK